MGATCVGVAVAVGSAAITSAGGVGVGVPETESSIPPTNSETCERNSGSWYARSPTTPMMIPIMSQNSIFN